jgi:6-phosphogluconolactonase (cycloisomerase 2 family)
MRQQKRVIVGLGVVAALALGGPAAASAATPSLYTLSNQPTGNEVIAFVRNVDGTLTPNGSYAAGGIGTGANLGSQGSVTLSRDGQRLFAVNPASDSVSLFAVKADGTLKLEDIAPSGGDLPISVTSHGNVVYVLNAGSGGDIAGFRLGKAGLRPIPGSRQPLGAISSNPAQISFAPSGKVLVVTEKGSSTIDTYRVGPGGRAATPEVHASSAGTPFGFDWDDDGHLLVSNASGSAASYDVDRRGHVSVISGAVATGQAAPCWLVSTPDGRWAYTANGGGGNLSAFAVSDAGGLSLVGSGVAFDLGAGSHPLDEAITRDGGFLYNLTDGRHVITGFAIGADGSLTPATSPMGVPIGTAGLAAS